MSAVQQSAQGSGSWSDGDHLKSRTESQEQKDAKATSIDQSAVDAAAKAAASAAAAALGSPSKEAMLKSGPSAGTVSYASKALENLDAQKSSQAQTMGKTL